MNANQILSAVAHKHHDGALVKEVLLTDARADPIRNLYEIKRAESYGKDSRYYQDIIEFYKDYEVADSIPDDWSPEPSSRRIDGLLYTNKKLIALEVKISVQDFKRETPAKRAPWEKVTNQFVYVTPEGLLNIDDIPKNCGLWEVRDNGAVIVTKKAKVNKNPDPMPQQVLVAFMYRLKSFR